VPALEVVVAADTEVMEHPKHPLCWFTGLALNPKPFRACRSALEAVVAADIELMELRAEEVELLSKLEHPEQQDADVSVGG
jgi:hypothetical protein